MTQRAGMKFLDHLSRFVAEESRGEPACRGDDMLTKTKPEHKEPNGLYDRIHVKEEPIEMPLRKLINYPSRGHQGSRKLQITPEIAKEMLKYNAPVDGHRNRPFRVTAAEQYAAEMTKGRWVATGHPIIFSDQGRLLDGQHRLQAVVMSGCTIDEYVQFGVPHETFDRIDTGIKRTSADIFAINGVLNATAMAAACNVVLGYDASRGGVSLGKGRAGSKDKLTNADLYDFYSRHEWMQDGMWVYTRMAKSKLASPSQMLALWFICARKSKREADAFFDVLTSGVGANGKYDPAKVARDRLLEMAIAGFRRSPRFTAFIVLTAWNRHRDGFSGRGLKFDAEKPVPRAH